MRLVLMSDTHGGYGEYFLHGVHFVNASLCDERYVPTNAPVVVDI